MSIEFLLSTMNLKLEDLDKMNIKCSCIVINQSGYVGYREYKNFKIYDTDDVGIAKSRNMALFKSQADIIVFCDNDCVYEDDVEKSILMEYSYNKKADLIIFNAHNLSRKMKDNDLVRRVRFYNYQRYGTYRISAKRNSILKANISFNLLFGNSHFSHGEDTLFLNDCLKNRLKIYTSKIFLCTVSDDNSTWFKGYDTKFFISKGALFKAISKHFCFLLCLQYLIRHKEVLKQNKYSFSYTYKKMLQGAKQFNDIS